MDEIVASAAEPAWLRRLSVRILKAYLWNNPIASADLPLLLEEIAATLSLLNRDGGRQAKAATPIPACPISKSVGPDFIICLESGKKFKYLTRHLYALGTTPASYRTKWGLPDDYPMIAPKYSEDRSRRARAIGLGMVPAVNAGQKRITIKMVAKKKATAKRNGAA